MKKKRKRGGQDRREDGARAELTPTRYHQQTNHPAAQVWSGGWDGRRGNARGERKRGLRRGGQRSFYSNDDVSKAQRYSVARAQRGGGSKRFAVPGMRSQAEVSLQSRLSVRVHPSHLAHSGQGPVVSIDQQIGLPCRGPARLGPIGNGDGCHRDAPFAPASTDTAGARIPGTFRRSCRLSPRPS